jgi:hypothetical protein
MEQTASARVQVQQPGTWGSPPEKISFMKKPVDIFFICWGDVDIT